MNCSTCWFASGGDADHCGYCDCCPAEVRAAVKPRELLSSFRPQWPEGAFERDRQAFAEFLERDWRRRQTIYELHEWTGGDDEEERCARCFTSWEDAGESCESPS